MKWIYFLIINVIAFSLMGLDKRKQRRNSGERQKVRCFIGGSWRSSWSLIGMYMFHHKTHKKKFRHTVTCCNNGMFIIRCMRNVERNAD